MITKSMDSRANGTTKASFHEKTPADILSEMSAIDRSRNTALQKKFYSIAGYLYSEACAFSEPLAYINNDWDEPGVGNEGLEGRALSNEHSHLVSHRYNIEEVGHSGECAVVLRGVGLSGGAGD